jgi:hypothetical protein
MKSLIRVEDGIEKRGWERGVFSSDPKKRIFHFDSRENAFSLSPSRGCMLHWSEKRASGKRKRAGKKGRREKRVPLLFPTRSRAKEKKTRNEKKKTKTKTVTDLGQVREELGLGPAEHVLDPLEPRAVLLVTSRHAHDDRGVDVAVSVPKGRLKVLMGGERERVGGEVRTQGRRREEGKGAKIGKTKNAKEPRARSPSLALSSPSSPHEKKREREEIDTSEIKRKKRRIKRAGKRRRRKTHTGYAGSCSATDTSFPNIICSLPMSHLLPSEMKTSSGFRPHEA